MLSGTLLSLSLPTNVPTIGTPSFSAATTTRLRWSFAAPLARIRVEVVGVVGERGDLEPVPVEHVADALHVELLDVDVTDPAYRRRSPPAAGQHATSSISNPFPAAQAGDLLQRESREGGGQESQLHGSTSVSTSTHRRSASDRATASPRTFPACPSSKVG